MYSMTGFGKGELEIDGRKLRVEMKSVNNRYLDINIRQPRFMFAYEEQMRQQIKEHIHRGRIDLFVHYSSEREDAADLRTDLGLALAYQEAAKKIAERTNIENNLTVTDLLTLPDVVTTEEVYEDDEVMKPLIEQCLQQAIEQLKISRKREGNQLKKDIDQRLKGLETYNHIISGKEDIVVAEYKEKIAERLEELLEGTEVDEQRLAQEVAIFADKANITEEAVRIASHLKQFQEISMTKGAQGRNMDFVVQELNREFNTIGSKSQDTEIMQIVIEAKGEIEKIREQIQNVE